MKRKTGKHLLLLLFLLPLLILLQNFIQQRSQASLLKPDTCFTETFREQALSSALYAELEERVHSDGARKAKRRVSVSGMLKILGVSRSGYRAWLKHVPSNAEKRRESVKAKIKDIYDKSKQNYGAPKITQVLRKTGETISERTVGQYMKQMGIKAQWVKPWTITTRDSDFSSKLQNILDEQFNPERPNAVWCSDITYIWTIDAFVYLTSIMDLYSRKIIAWTLSNTLEVSCVIETINKAKARRKIEEPLIMHSDRSRTCLEIGPFL